MRSVCAALLCLMAFPAAADPAAMALNFADGFAVPRFQAVAVAAHAQQDAWTAFCADRKHENPQKLIDAFNATADAWADVEFVRIGPAAVALRAERFNWWLDRTDATGKALAAMLADKQAPTPETLAAGSVAGQGLPVLERLLYDKGAIVLLKGKSGARRCAIGEPVARGQAAIADAIVADWAEARAALAANARWNVAFADAKEAADVMLTDLVAALESLKDYKVAMLFHDETNAKAPRLAEAGRSKRTIRDIARNLAAIREGLRLFLGNASPSDRARIEESFDDADNALKALETAKPEGRAEAAKVALAAFAVLSRTAVTVLPEATGLNLGFNSLDGD